jgi:hypothetical protein
MVIIIPVYPHLELTDILEVFLYVIATLFAALLIVLSVSSYLKTGLKKLKYAILAFSLFFGFLIYENLELIFKIDYPLTDIVIPSMALAILVLFFLAITKRA